MPMVIFQQAKDMKLDTGLFFISIIAVYIVYKLKISTPDNGFPSLKEHNNSNKSTDIKSSSMSLKESKKQNFKKEIKHWKFVGKENLIFILIVWLLCWFAFSIKLTSLILISSLIWVLFFSRLGILWFLWYLSLFLGFFTKFWFWDYMNVSYPKDDISLINIFSFFSILIWLSFLGISLKNRFNIIKKILLEFSIFVCWILIALLPWVYKNICDSLPNISVATIIWWKADNFDPDYSKIYILKKNLRI